MPKIEPNMTEAEITQWLKKENEFVEKREPLFIIETAKAAIEVVAEESGYLRKIIVPQNETVPILTVVALLGTQDEPLPEPSSLQIERMSLEEKKEERKEKMEIEEKEEIEEIVKAEEEAEAKPEVVVLREKIRASPAAKRVAREEKIDLSGITGTGPRGRIVEKDVREKIIKEKAVRENEGIKEQAVLKKGRHRILIIGAGNGGEVVADILSSAQENEIIGFLDDDEKLWGTQLSGKPVFGAVKLVDRLWDESRFDSVIISITMNMNLRRRLFEEIESKSYKIINAIHPRAYVNPAARLGEGNIICASVHVGYGTNIGNNNLISAHCNVEHHNIIGSHTLFGPGVMTSGNVKIGDECSLGAGVNIEPYVTIGNKAAIASGSTIIGDVAEGRVVKEIRRL